MVKLAILASPLVLALAAEWPRTGTIEDVKHIVIFMQENRAFDHYYGKLKGVRGFNDPVASVLPSGHSSFFQPTKEGNGSYQLPYKIWFANSSASCMAAPEMDFPCDVRMWNQGLMDGWDTGRDAGFGMGYFGRDDLPYYYALADAFTIGDQYFQSTLTATNPNRLHLFSGSNGASVGKPAIMDDTESGVEIDWETFGETLENANVSWRVYMEQDNFDDNAFAWFDQYKKAKPGEALFDKGMLRSHDVVAEFEADIKAGKLPQVSYIVGPTALSEHAEHHPADGEDLTARLLKVLQDNPAVYKETAFILNYDEGGQFYDHAWIPVPPSKDGPTAGKSTVDTKGEFADDKGNPTGFGFRVPFMAISPWSKGGYVVSEVFDHTSVLKFVERRFGVRCPNISPWRRTVAGDLTSAFDFTHFDPTWPSLPNTSANINHSAYQCKNLPKPVVPKQQTLPSQEPGTKRSRPLPYEFLVSGEVVQNSFTMTIKNEGTAGAAFYVYDMLALPKGLPPRHYTVEAKKALDDSWVLDGSQYSFALYGPNGFLRHFAGSGKVPATVTADLQHQKSDGSVSIMVQYSGMTPCTGTVVDLQNNKGNMTLALPKPGPYHSTVSVKESGNWYDISLVVACDGVGDSTASFRYMGRMETGLATTTDPRMGAGPSHWYVAPVSDKDHPLTPDRLINPARHKPDVSDGYTKDQCHLHCRNGAIGPLGIETENLQIVI